MHTVVFADDEGLFRDAVMEQVDWESFGFTCIGACEDGLEALALVEQHRPDLLITDIGMPFLDGIELTRKVKMIAPETKVVLLTGYNDFDYAQQALKLQASDYILKPITAAEFAHVLTNIKEQLTMIDEQKQRWQKLNAQLRVQRPMLQERFIERLLTEPMTATEVESECAFFELTLRLGKRYCEVIIHVEPADDGAEFAETSIVIQQKYETQLLKFAVYNVATELANDDDTLGYSCGYRDRNGQSSLLFELSEEGDGDSVVPASIRSYAQRLLHTVDQLLPVSITIALGASFRYDAPEDFQRIHQSAMQALAQRFVLGQERILAQPIGVRSVDQATLVAFINEEAQLLQALRNGTDDEAKAALKRIVARQQMQLLADDFSAVWLQRLALNIVCIAYEFTSTFTFAMRNVNEFATLDEAARWLEELCNIVTRLVREYRLETSEDSVSKVVAYLQEHYADEELSLTVISKHVAMNASYLSTVFKQQMGLSFIEYLTELRMNQAQTLLGQPGPMKNYEIAYAVGYKDPQYFSVAFKKHTGMSPSEYRQKYEGGSH